MQLHRTLPTRAAGRCCAPLSARHAAHSQRRPAVLVTKAVAAKEEVYVPPSQATGANELQALERLSVVVPDTFLMQKLQDLERPKAATVSARVLSGILSSPTSMQDFKTAVERAVSYDKCSVQVGDARANCQYDKALANVGALFAQQVEGRVSTEVDPRCAYDTDALVARGQQLLELYQELGVAKERVLLRLPATWEGVRAAEQLEQAGALTHLVLVFSFVQGAAAAQAGASVVQPNVGRLADWYATHPGVIRDPSGPREDSGFKSDVNPGAVLAEKIYCYVRKYYPKTKVMAAGLRNKADALRLAGCDYLVVSPRVLSELATTATLAGYNDGLSATAAEGDELSVPAQLTPEVAGEVEFSAAEVAAVTEEGFKEGLGGVGRELLDAGVASLRADVEALLPMFGGVALGME